MSYCAGEMPRLVLSCDIEKSTLRFCIAWSMSLMKSFCFCRLGQCISPPTIHSSVHQRALHASASRASHNFSSFKPKDTTQNFKSY